MPTQEKRSSGTGEYAGLMGDELCPINNLRRRCNQENPQLEVQTTSLTPDPTQRHSTSRHAPGSRPPLLNRGRCSNLLICDQLQQLLHHHQIYATRLPACRATLRDLDDSYAVVLVHDPQHLCQHDPSQPRGY